MTICDPHLGEMREECRETYMQAGPKLLIQPLAVVKLKRRSQKLQDVRL
jgi:hypothetical protein